VGAITLISMGKYAIASICLVGISEGKLDTIKIRKKIRQVVTILVTTAPTLLKNLPATAPITTKIKARGGAI
jgi:hypothetical protein